MSPSTPSSSRTSRVRILSPRPRAAREAAARIEATPISKSSPLRSSHGEPSSHLSQSCGGPPGNASSLLAIAEFSPIRGTVRLLQMLHLLSLMCSLLTGGSPAQDPGTKIHRSHHAHLLTAAELAERWRVDRVTVYKMVRSGRLPAIPLGRHYRFRLDLIERWEATQGQDETSTHDEETR